MVKVGLLTLGCKVNQSETNALEERLGNCGFDIISFRKHADVYVINTCSVTSRSDRKSREYIRSALRRNGNAEIIVTGCYSQREADEVRSIPGNIKVFSNTDKKNIAEYLIKEYTGKKETNKNSLPFKNGRTRAFLKIQDGCRRFCRYCIIPYARNELYSSPVTEVVGKARQLVAGGFREVVLCGINFGYYDNLPGLLEELCLIKNLDRLRISSIEPVDVSGRLIQLIKNLPVICPHLHIPLQSGSDRVLELMGRGYTSGEYGKLIDSLRTEIPGMGITTDVIVGFPGETEEDFRRTCDFVRKTGFSKIHVFRYSPRPGTEAAKMKEKVPEAVKKERSRKLLDLEAQERTRFWKGYMKKTLDVLLEKEMSIPGLGAHFTGFSDNYIKVAARGKAAVNSIVPVRIESMGENQVVGEILN